LNAKKDTAKKGIYNLPFIVPFPRETFTGYSLTLAMMLLKARQNGMLRSAF